MNSKPLTHSVVADLIEYAERYADSNDEPTNGDCRRTIEAGKQYLSEATASLSQTQGPDLAGVLANLVQAVEFTPLGIRGITAVVAAKLALGETPGWGYGRVSRTTPEARYIEVTVPASFDSEQHTIFEALENGAVVGQVFDVSRDVLVAAVAALSALIAEAGVPGGIGPHEFTRPGGWLERAQKELQAIPAGARVDELAVPPDRRFSATWTDAFSDPGTSTVTGGFFTRDAGYDTEDLVGIAALEVGETWEAHHYGPAHTVTRLPDTE